MKTNSKLVLALLTVIFGWLMAGFGFTTKLGHPVSTICFYLGLALIPIGIILFIKFTNEK